MTGNLLRQLVYELRKALPERRLKNNLAFQQIIDQFRRYKTTDEQMCKARDEMEFIARTYLCYLRSCRIKNIIDDKFQGKGEMTVDETAKMVGFKLPGDSKSTNFQP